MDVADGGGQIGKATRQTGNLLNGHIVLREVELVEHRKGLFGHQAALLEDQSDVAEAEAGGESKREWGPQKHNRPAIYRPLPVQ